MAAAVEFAHVRPASDDAVEVVADAENDDLPLLLEPTADGLAGVRSGAAADRRVEHDHQGIRARGFRSGVAGGRGGAGRRRSDGRRLMGPGADPWIAAWLPLAAAVAAEYGGTVRAWLAVEPSGLLLALGALLVDGAAVGASDGAAVGAARAIRPRRFGRSRRSGWTFTGSDYGRVARMARARLPRRQGGGRTGERAETGARYARIRGHAQAGRRGRVRCAVCRRRLDGPVARGGVCRASRRRQGPAGGAERSRSGLPRGPGRRAPVVGSCGASYRQHEYASRRVWRRVAAGGDACSHDYRRPGQARHHDPALRAAGRRSRRTCSTC